MVREIAAIAGLTCLGVGVWMLSPAWALIIIGLVVLLACAWGYWNAH